MSASLLRCGWESARRPKSPCPRCSSTTATCPITDSWPSTAALAMCAATTITNSPMTGWCRMWRRWAHALNTRSAPRSRCATRRSTAITQPTRARPRRIASAPSPAASSRPCPPPPQATAPPLDQLYQRYVSHDRKIQDRSIYNQTDLLAKFDTGSIKHTLIAGMELGYDTYDNQAYTRKNLPYGPIIDPAPLSTPSNSVTSTGNLAQTTGSTVAQYANDTLEQ